MLIAAYDMPRKNLPANFYQLIWLKPSASYITVLGFMENADCGCPIHFTSYVLQLATCEQLTMDTGFPLVSPNKNPT